MNRRAMKRNSRSSNRLHCRSSDDPVGSPPGLDADHIIGQDLRSDAKIWSMYVAEATAHDDSMLESWNDALDVRLILAGLFSAVLTAFVVESYKLLQPDPQDDTIAILTQIAQRLNSPNLINDSVVIPSVPSASSSLPSSQTFKPSAYAWWLNVMWFSSLACSLSAAFIAMLVKQWLQAYPVDRPGRMELLARQRHFRYAGLLKWKVSEIISTLPALLQIGFGLFFGGLNILLWSINRPIAYFMMVLTGLLLGFFSTTALAPLFDSACPYKTPFSLTVRSQIRRMCLFFGALVEYIPALFAALKGRFRTEIPSIGRWLDDIATSNVEIEQIDIDESHHDINLGVVEWLIAVSHEHEVVDTALKAIASLRPDFNATPKLRDSGAIQLLTDRLDPPEISRSSVSAAVVFRNHAAKSIPYLASIHCSLRHCTMKDIIHIASQFHWRAWVVSWGDFTLDQLISDGWDLDALALYLCASTQCDRAQGRRANREFWVMLELLNKYSRGNTEMCSFAVWALIDSVALWGAEFGEASMFSTRPAVVACLLRLLAQPYTMGDPITCAIGVALGIFVLDFHEDDIAKYRDEEKRQQDAHVLLIRGVVEIMKETPGSCLRYGLDKDDFEAGGMAICKLLIENNVSSWSTGVSSVLVGILSSSTSERLTCRVLETFRRLLSFDSQSSVPNLSSAVIPLLGISAGQQVQIKATQMIGELMHWRDHREAIITGDGVRLLIRNLTSPSAELSNASSYALIPLARNTNARGILVDLGLVEALTIFFGSNNASQQNLVYWSLTFVGSSWTESKENSTAANEFRTAFHELSQVLEASMRHGGGSQRDVPLTPTRRRDLQRVLLRLKHLSGGSEGGT